MRSFIRTAVSRSDIDIRIRHRQRQERRASLGSLTARPMAEASRDPPIETNGSGTTHARSHAQILRHPAAKMTGVRRHSPLLGRIASTALLRVLASM